MVAVSLAAWRVLVDRVRRRPLGKPNEAGVALDMLAALAPDTAQLAEQTDPGRGPTPGEHA